MTMSKLTAKQKADIRAATTHDVTFHADGTFTVKEHYYYRHDRSPEKLAEHVLEAVPGVEVVDKGDRWQVWPKDSFFWVKCRRVEG